MSTFFRFVKIIIGVLGVLVIASIYFGEEVGEIYSPMSSCSSTGFGKNSLEWLEPNQLALFWSPRSSESSFVLIANIHGEEAQTFFVSPIQKAILGSWHNSFKQVLYTSTDIVFPKKTCRIRWV